MEEKRNIKKGKLNLKLVFILLAIGFASQSIVFLLRGNSINNFDPNFTFFCSNFTKQITMGKAIGAFLYVVFFVGLMLTYFGLLKKREEYFKDKKALAKFILIVSAIFLIILPLTSSDIFYYMGTGWSEAKYEVNPYYTSVTDVIKQTDTMHQENPDQMLLRTPGVWQSSTIVYGPLWPLLCRALSALSFGNVGLGLLVYKLFNLILHLASCYLIFKISRGNKLFTLLYAINPFVLFEGLSNVHNDILVVFFVLLALYYLVRKKKILPVVIAIAMATAVKYYAILLMPFLLLYYYRDKKPLQRIGYAVGWALVFLVILLGCYLVYTQDFAVLKGIMTQQGKFANSLFLLIVLGKDIKTAGLVANGFMLAFIAIYIFTVIRLIFTKKKLTFTGLMREYNVLLLLFIFGTITNFQSWYILWLFPTLLWQKSKTIHKILNVATATQIGKVVFFVLYETYHFQPYVIGISVVTYLVLNRIDKNDVLNTKKNKKEKWDIGK